MSVILFMFGFLQDEWQKYHDQIAPHVEFYCNKHVEVWLEHIIDHSIPQAFALEDGFVQVFDTRSRDRQVLKKLIRNLNFLEVYKGMILTVTAN